MQVQQCAHSVQLFDALIDTLREAGCEIECLKNEGYPPLTIKADGMRGGKVTIL